VSPTRTDYSERQTVTIAKCPHCGYRNATRTTTVLHRGLAMAIKTDCPACRDKTRGGFGTGSACAVWEEHRI